MTAAAKLDLQEISESSSFVEILTSFPIIFNKIGVYHKKFNIVKIQDGGGRHIEFAVLRISGPLQ